MSPLRRDWRNTALRFENVSKPARPWYSPMPEGPTPPNGSSSWAMCTRVSFTPTPPETVRWLDRSEAAPAANHRFLDSAAVVMTAAFVPVVLAASLPDEPAARAHAIREVVDAFDRAVSGLSPAVQKEVEQLFSVLRFAPSLIMPMSDLEEGFERFHKAIADIVG